MINTMFYLFSKDFWAHSGILFLFGIVIKLLWEWYLELPSDGKKASSSGNKNTDFNFSNYLKELIEFSVKFFGIAIAIGVFLGILSKAVSEVKSVLTYIPILKYFILLSNTWCCIGVFAGIILYSMKLIHKYAKQPLPKILDLKEKSEQKNSQRKSNQLNFKDGCPPLSLLTGISDNRNVEHQNEMKAKLEHCFKEYELSFLKISKTEVGPTITRFTVSMNTTGRIGNVMKLEREMSMFLGVESISIKPSANGLVFEVPNSRRNNVSYKETIDLFISTNSKNPLLIPLGKTAVGELLTLELNLMPHILVAGTTGSGKSVCINGIVSSILLKATPEEVKFIFIDPKVVEFSGYNGIPHLLAPVVTDAEQATKMLNWAVKEMERRYEEFANVGVKNIEAYNSKVSGKDQMPFIVIVIDELADLLIGSKRSNNETAGSVEESIQRLGQMARAAGIHLVVGTQRPSADVVTGTIKTNIPGRIAFAVSDGTNSRIIIDENGAEKLLGRGDGLLLTTATRTPIRFQSAFISDEEVENIVNWWKEKNSGAEYINNYFEIKDEPETTEANTGEDDTQSKQGNIKEISSTLVKKYVAELALSDDEEIYLPAMNKILEEIAISKPYLVEQINILVNEEWLEKSGDSPRNTKYKIVVGQKEAASWLINIQN